MKNSAKKRSAPPGDGGSAPNQATNARSARASLVEHEKGVRPAVAAAAYAASPASHSAFSRSEWRPESLLSAPVVGPPNLQMRHAGADRHYGLTRLDGAGKGRRGRPLLLLSCEGCRHLRATSYCRPARRTRRPLRVERALSNR